MMKKIAVIIACLCFLFAGRVVLAKIGVGVGTGKIQLNEELKLGGIYDLPPLVVYNTGSESADFEVGIAFQNDVPQKRPSKEWLSFKPKNFRLDPGGAQSVEVVLNLPLKTEPGDYFCYAEAKPVDKTVERGGTKIGVAAAAKVYFTIAPANLWQALYYKAVYFWKHYAPWTYIATLVLVLAVLLVLIRRFFTFQIGFGWKDKFEDQTENFGSVPARGRVSLDDILFQALLEVERYTANFTHSQTENIFQESTELKPYIVSFFRYRDSRVLSMASPELKNILLLSRDGLNKIEREYPQYSSQALEKVVRGLVG